ncbi:MAG TPA: hypothetical protein VJ898_03760 [Natrialbaceae archaeon]|nr:hypothetical protein [Natrialbaceae archaeon]
MSVPADSDSEPDSTLVETIRTVTPPTPSRPNLEMSTFGWGVFLGLVILLIPLLPFVVIIWAISKLLERSNRTP